MSFLIACHQLLTIIMQLSMIMSVGISLLIFLQGNLYGYDQLEDAILEMDRVDVWYDNRRVIQNLKHHDDSQDV